MSIEDKPYGYVRKDGGGMFVYGEHQVQNTFGYELVPIYLRPQREWVGLTDEERDEIYLAVELGACGEALIEAKLKEKNNT